MIDLHTHSDFSDGSLSPEALAALAAESGLTAVALTDHDTMAGAARFCAACRRLQLCGIAGVEISADFSPGTMHILGYFPDMPGTGVTEALVRIREGRRDRNTRILETLAGLNMALDAGELATLAGDGVAGRPHIAQAMVSHGYVRDFREAFDRWLGKGKPAYHDRYRLGPVAAVETIVAAGGAAVLAHPFTLKLPPRALRAMLDDLAAAGLAGIEVFYPEHSQPLRQLYTTLAKERDLVLTGGSDFHGDLNPAIRIGRGFGNVHVQDRVLADLESRTGLTF